MRWDSRAFDLLCAIVRPRPDLERAREILQEGVDIDVLFCLATHHAVRPHLGPLVALGLAPAPAQALREKLGGFEREHVARSLAMVAELVRVIDAFGRAAIPVVAFKGPVLAQQLYGGLVHREYADLDLLVPPDRAAAAQALLATLGYRNAQGDPAFVRAFLGAQRQVALERPGLDGAIDDPALGSPAEVAAAALFLASEDSRFMSGQRVVVDNGIMHMPGMLLPSA